MIAGVDDGVSPARRRWPGLAIVVGGLALSVSAWGAERAPVAGASIMFELRTRWGQRLEGVFAPPVLQVSDLPGGMQRITVTVQAASVEIIGHRRYTQFARGPRFFDVERHPVVRFQSDPYPPELLLRGGRVGGVVQMHGVGRREMFTVPPAACARPAIDCELVAHGRLRREDYGMEDWQWAVRSQVGFTLRVRRREGATP